MFNFKKKFSHAVFIFLVIVCSSVGGILYGYDIGVYSGALPFIKEALNLSTSQLGILGGAVFGGGLVGTIITGYLSDRFGRRAMIMIASNIFIIGVILLLFSHAFSSLLLARIIMGLGVGITAVSVPSYLAEIAPASIRGVSIATFQLFLTLGILAAYTVDAIFTPSGNWRAMFAVISIPALFLSTTMWLLPESPRWLVSNGKVQQAYNALERTRAIEEAKSEIQEISLSLTSNRQPTWRNLLSRSLLFPLFISVFIAVFNQLTAINGFLQYAPTIFNSAGFSSHVSAMQCSIILGAINFVGTVVGMFLVDKIGRRILLKLGIGGIVVAYLFLAISHRTHFPPISALIGLVIFIFSFAVGPGMVAWIIASELFPTNVRGKGMSVVLFCASLAGCVVTTLFLQTEEKLGLEGIYWLFGAFTLVYFFVIARFLPETKQKTLEQIASLNEAKN